MVSGVFFERVKTSELLWSAAVSKIFCFEKAEKRNCEAKSGVEADTVRAAANVHSAHAANENNDRVCDVFINDNRSCSVSHNRLVWTVSRDTALYHRIQNTHRESALFVVQ